MNVIRRFLGTKIVMFLAGLWIGGFGIAIMMEVGGDHLASQLADLKFEHEHLQAYAEKCRVLSDDMATILEGYGYKKIIVDEY